MILGRSKITPFRDGEFESFGGKNEPFAVVNGVFKWFLRRIAFAFASGRLSTLRTGSSSSGVMDDISGEFLWFAD